MTTYKQLQDSWIRSEWVNNGVEDFGEDAPVIIPAGFVSVTLEDLIKKRVKKKIIMILSNLQTISWWKM